MMKLYNGIRYVRTEAFQSLWRVKNNRNLDRNQNVTNSIKVRVLFALGILGILYGFEWIAGILEDLITMLIELIQESLETLYRKQFKLDIYHAQMATAYTGFVMMLGMGYLFALKISLLMNTIHKRWDHGRENAMDAFWFYWNKAMEWWDSIDNLNKCFTLIGLVMVALPLVSIACIALGTVVAELI
jgi:hypothetical protein